MSDIAELLRSVRETRDQISRADAERQATLAELKRGKADVVQLEKLERLCSDITSKTVSLEATLNAMVLRNGRPGYEFTPESEAAASRGLLELKHAISVPKRDQFVQFSPSPEAIREAEVAIRAQRQLFRGTVANLTPDETKALSSFNMGASGFILAPEMSSRILSCLVDPSDIVGLMSSISISGPSVRFLVDNARLDQAAWACQTDCWSPAYVKNLTEGLGELELKPEPLRYVICATRDLLEDASINIEAWLLAKVNFAFRNTMATAVLSGDGAGKPLGILHPSAGLPVCETAPLTPAGLISWQDLIALKWQVGVQWHAGARYLMNQNSFGLLLSMSDAMGRPLMIATPADNGQFVIGGSPVSVVSQMPDIAPGTTPIAFGNWAAVYMIVNRKSVTMQQDPYSAGFCILYKFESRIGGGVICPLAARLLRIR